MVGAYCGFLKDDDEYSCDNILGRGVLAPDWTITRLELGALNLASNVKTILERALDGWIEAIYVGGDSEVALCWCSYENVKLQTFHRNRVNNIRSRVNLDQL